MDEKLTDLYTIYETLKDGYQSSTWVSEENMIGDYFKRGSEMEALLKTNYFEQMMAVARVDTPEKSFIVSFSELRKILKDSSQEVMKDKIEEYLLYFFQHFIIFSLKGRKKGDSIMRTPVPEDTRTLRMTLSEFNHTTFHNHSQGIIRVVDLLNTFMSFQTSKKALRPLNASELLSFLDQEKPDYSKILRDLQCAVAPRASHDLYKAIQSDWSLNKIPKYYYTNTAA